MPSAAQNTKKKILAYKKLEKYKSENAPQLSKQVFEGEIKNEFLQMPPKLRFDVAIKFDGGGSYLLYHRGRTLEHGKDAKHVRCGFGINIIGEK